MVILAGVRSGSLASFSMSISTVRFENQVLLHNDPHRPTGADGQGRLDVEVLFGDALAGLI